MRTSRPPGPALVAAAADADPVTLLVLGWLAAKRSENTRAAYARDIGITPQRQESFDFVPYFQGGVRLITRKDTNHSFNSEDDLCGLSVATQTGSTEAIGLERANKETCPEGKKITIMGYPNFNEAVQQLRKKVAEVAFLDWPFANYLAQTVPDLKLASPILSCTPGRPRNKHGMVVRKGDSAMLQALTESLKRSQASGEYDKILAKWNLTEGDIREVR